MDRRYGIYDVGRLAEPVKSFSGPAAGGTVQYTGPYTGRTDSCVVCSHKSLSLSAEGDIGIWNIIQLMCNRPRYVSLHRWVRES